jgi:choline dehydrogenase-like flavoprotein
MTDHYDIIVIGSGAGGGTLTYSLAPTGKQILLLERGSWYPRERDNSGPINADASSTRNSTTTSVATPRSTARCCSACASATSATSGTSTAFRPPGP